MSQQMYVQGRACNFHDVLYIFCEGNSLRDENPVYKQFVSPQIGDVIQQGTVLNWHFMIYDKSGSRLDMTQKYLNGWRRLGIVLAAVWLVAIALIASFGRDSAAYEFMSYEVSVTQMYPVPAPELKAALEAEKVKKLGRELKPWEMEWNPTKLVPAELKVKERQFSASKAFFIAFILPAAFWLLLELGVGIGRWVLAGFRAPDASGRLE